jgi:hypothetical protein
VRRSVHCTALCSVCSLRRAKFPIIYPDLRLDYKVATHPCGLNVLVQDLLEQVMHWHFVAMISRKLCMKRAQGGVEVLMTTAASAAIVIRIRAVNVYKFSLNFSKLS